MRTNDPFMDPLQTRAPQLLSKIRHSLRQHPAPEVREDLEVACDILERSGNQDLEQISSRLYSKCCPTPFSTKVLFSSISATVVGLLTAIPLPVVGLTLLTAGGLGIGGSFWQHKRAHQRLESFNAALNHEMIKQDL